MLYKLKNNKCFISTNMLNSKEFSTSNKNLTYTSNNNNNQQLTYTSNNNNNKHLNSLCSK